MVLAKKIFEWLVWCWKELIDGGVEVATPVLHLN